MLEAVDTIRGRVNMQALEFTQDMCKDYLDEDGHLALRMFTLRNTFGK